MSRPHPLQAAAFLFPAPRGESPAMRIRRALVSPLERLVTEPGRATALADRAGLFGLAVAGAGVLIALTALLGAGPPA